MTNIVLKLNAVEIQAVKQINIFRVSQHSHIGNLYFDIKQNI